MKHAGHIECLEREPIVVPSADPIKRLKKENAH
ncbi:MAG: hypothetical protein JWN86_1739 [Planctomycetota bacterium]|nr:hypothetical protein [Planctomycetota bacterium]